MFKIGLWLVRWFLGSVRIRVHCTKIERLINALNNSEVYVWNFSAVGEDYYEFDMYIKDLKGNKRILRKTHTTFRIQKRHGLPFFLFRNRHKKVMALGVITSFIVVVYLSGFIWDIRLNGNYTYTYDEIADVLGECGIKEGLRKEKVNGAEIEKYLRNRYFDIKWVSVEIRGTVMDISIRENFDRFITSNTNQPSDIVAVSDGTVNSIVTRKGVPLVKTGDEVKAGDVLISGTVQVLGDSEEVINTHYVVADGDILINTEYDYNDTFPLKRIVKEYTGNEKTMYFFGIFNNLYCIKAGKIKYEEYDILSNTENAIIGDDFMLPFSFSKKVVREYKTYDKVYTKEEAEAVAMANIQNFVDNLKNKGAVKIDICTDTDITRYNAVTKGKIYVIEPAVKYQTIETINKED